ncbi:hypothetical protein CEUSTIGMA_g11449.t1 [Chlamydomonas eustigma]|uniref:Vacuolar protein sorting-associated protein 35 n=1 Tax=Chlamydomonas eustigma TaxID=1157962 RepID=A0A250XLS6_9CHLO|nr:hypothetical protein CEUSTIGMA_g11449.t1 [Chlamydomonas eustigma]|eukprot:GAX84024.1 hypothetical protein CEUSTIGMA_g11449.t1 [Chlamydomonas eustigma]
MRKSIEEDDNLREALRYSAAMLGELRTSLLSPQKYYELYMMVFDQLVNLEAFFSEERNKGRSFSELYELVQHAGNVLPRLYLMVAVGCLYIRSKEAKAKEILKDLVELCKGVQHPTRGLFLRSYLCQRSKGLLPDTGSPYEGNGGGDIHDAVDFLLSNFIEMNKLWVRMQHQGNARDKEKREQERQQLQDLVGKNLTYLSQLDGLDYELYAGMVLPRVIEQVVSCKDGIAQQYLMQCIIQGFPDAFHLGTLDVLLGALPELQPEVKVHAIMSSLMDRLAKYAESDAAVMQRLLEMKAFEKFRDSIGRVLNAQTDMAAADKVEMFVALMNFTGSVLPNIVDNVNQVLAAAHAALATGLSGDIKAEKQLVALLTIPLTKYDVVTGLGLTEYPILMGLLRHRTHKELASKIIHAIVDSGTRIHSVEKVAMLFRFISPLIKDVEGGPRVDDMDEEDIEEEQVLVARLIHSLFHEDPVIHHAILSLAKSELMHGGARRVRHTLPALGFCALQIVRRISSASKASPSLRNNAECEAGFGAASPDINAETTETDAEAVNIEVKAVDAEAEADVTAAAANASELTAGALLQWVLELCNVLAEVPREPMMALRMLLAAGLAASEEARVELLAYQFFEEAFTLYEEGISDQRNRVTALHSIIGTLNRCYIFGSENRDALTQNAAAYSSRLLKRSDQCHSVCECSHLSWQDDSTEVPGVAVRDSARVMSCLKRALKIANSAKQQVTVAARAGDCSYITLYIEILEHYLFYFDRSVENFTASVLQPVIDMVQSEVMLSLTKAGDSEARRLWSKTLEYIHQLKVKATGDKVVRYSALQLPSFQQDSKAYL